LDCGRAISDPSRSTDAIELPLTYPYTFGPSTKPSGSGSPARKGGAMSAPSIQVVEAAVNEAANELYMACSRAALDRVKTRLLEQSVELDDLRREARRLLLTEDVD